MQVGVGIPNGAEAIVHSVRTILDCKSLPTNHKYILQVDFSNAFNSANRLQLFEYVREHLPSAASWFELCYRSSPLLHLENHVILSQCGVQQGDPLGPLGFAMVLHPLLQELKSQVPDLVMNAWYLDGGVLYGKPDDLIRAIDIIASIGPSLALAFR